MHETEQTVYRHAAIAADAAGQTTLQEWERSRL